MSKTDWLPPNEDSEDSDLSSFHEILLAQEILFVVLVLCLLAVCGCLVWQLLQFSALLRQERSVRRFGPRAGLGLAPGDVQRLLSEPAPEGAPGALECCVCLQEILPSSPSLRHLENARFTLLLPALPPRMHRGVACGRGALPHVS
ncbi:unnamed protein product [Cladocopium goreaui]|uniref:RING-type E3 ubiquitin transferase n=1 Tax=Cladocopium goreaui TaxID=2562237 RepID=A0A9P1BWG5_9DINO|nr:unnamed protein product [Cladocopium goreaui]